MVTSKNGEVLIRPNYENKLSCEFNMSRLQVTFTLHNLSVEDEKQYGLHVEFERLTRNPLTDAVTLRLHGNNTALQLEIHVYKDCSLKGVSECRRKTTNTL